MVCTIAFTSNLNAQIRSIDPPIMGWSSWNTYRVNINEDLIKKQADAMVSQGLKEVGYSFVNVDDGFFGYRDEKGVLHAHAERFPNGMKPIADYIHSLGLKAGLYSEAGANTCGSIWDADKNGIGVGLYGYERQDADLFFNQWGFDFIKIDYCGAGQQLELDEKERYTTIVNAIREVCDCLKDFGSEKTEGIKRIQHTINLKKGYNVIRIGNRYTWVPDLDCFTLTPKK